MSAEFKVNIPKAATADMSGAFAASNTRAVFDSPKAAADLAKAEPNMQIPEVNASKTKNAQENTGGVKKAAGNAWKWMKKPFVDAAAYETKWGRAAGGAGRVAVVVIPAYIAGKALFGGKSEPEASYTYPENDNARGGFAAAEDARRAGSANAEMSI